MRYSSVNRGFPAGNPLANVLVIVVGTLAIAASLVLGFFVFVILGSLLLVLAAIFGVRLWWFRRRMTKSPANAATTSHEAGAAPETIEGEYHVIIEERDRDEP